MRKEHLRFWSKIALAASVSGCASIQSQYETLTTDNEAATTFYAQCAAADVVSTFAFLKMTTMYEVNPVVNHFAIPALGHVAGVIVPAIGLSIAAYYGLRWLNEPKVSAAAAALTCASAVRNVYQIGHVETGPGWFQ